MPVTAPELKIKAVKNFGAKVVLHGDNYNQALRKAKSLAAAKSRNLLMLLMIFIRLLVKAPLAKRLWKINIYSMRYLSLLGEVVFLLALQLMCLPSLQPQKYMGLRSMTALA